MDGTKITTGHMVADTDGLREKAATVSRAERDAIRGRWGTPEVAFLAVGRLNERKGIRELLAAWALLERRNPGPWRMVLVGAGDDGDALRRQAQDLGLSGVTFHGPADYDEIARFYAAADVLVMPTLEDNWSLVVPEAMACGLPVLCSIYNGCHPELVAPGFNGWTFDPLAVEDTLRGLATALENRARLPEMGRASLAIVARHTPEHAADAILGACRIALANRQGDGHARLARP
jgi:glycosyltransferase involved in cell wall biosynthesis